MGGQADCPRTVSRGHRPGRAVLRSPARTAPVRSRHSRQLRVLQATYTTSALSSGTHVITAAYSGDGTFLASNASLSQGVGQTSTAGTTTTLSSSVSPAASGQSCGRGTRSRWPRCRRSVSASPLCPKAGTPSPYPARERNRCGVGDDLAVESRVTVADWEAEIHRGGGREKVVGDMRTLGSVFGSPPSWGR
jgi:hypothetical protein